MTLILEGKTLAGRIHAAAAVHAAEVRTRLGRPPALAAVAIDTGRPETLYFDVKQSAFESAGARFIPHVLPRGTTTDGLTACVESLNADARVDGIYVQYPLPAEIDGQSVYDVIAPAKDVDGASSLQPDPPHFFPATAEAVVQLLVHHEIPLVHRTIAIVRGDPLFADILAALFERERAYATVVATEAEAGSEAGSVVGTAVGTAVGSADVVVVATGVVNGVPASALREGAVAVDVGYYHGGGRGDIEATPADIARLMAYARPRGAIGPLTVALLVAHTAEAAARTLTAGAVR